MVVVKFSEVSLSRMMVSYQVALPYLFSKSKTANYYMYCLPRQSLYFSSANITTVMLPLVIFHEVIHDTLVHYYYYYYYYLRGLSYSTVVTACL